MRDIREKRGERREERGERRKDRGQRTEGRGQRRDLDSEERGQTLRTGERGDWGTHGSIDP